MPLEVLWKQFERKTRKDSCLERKARKDLKVKRRCELATTRLRYFLISLGGDWMMEMESEFVV